MASPYPHLFDNIGFLHRQTQMYTQRRQNSELPENYKFTVEEFMTFVIVDFGLITAADITYTHSQGTPSTTWTINHNLNRNVQVRCKDSDDINIVGDIIDDNMNAITILFTTPVEGIAFIT